MFGKKAIFNFVILIWFLFWYFIDSLNLTGFNPLSAKGKNVIDSFFFSFIAGTVFVYPFRRKWSQFRFGKKISRTEYLKNYQILSKFFLFLLTPIYIFFTSRAIYLMNTRFSLSQYRSDVFGLISGSSTLFFNISSFSLLYFYFILPVLFFGVFVGFGYLLRFKKFGLLLVSLVLMALDSVMMAGRFGFHYIFFSGILLFVFKANVNYFKVSLRLMTVICAFILVATYSVYFISETRSINGQSNIKNLFENFVIDYHTESFHILDYELNQPDSIIHDFTLGFSTFSGIERYLLLLPNFIKLTSKIPEVDIIGGFLHPARNLGIDHFGNIKWYNAYASSLFVLYRDGAIFGVVLGSFLLGFFVQGLAYRLPMSVFSSTLLLTGFMFMSIYSLFQAAFTGPMLAGYILSIFTIMKIKLNRNNI